MATTTVLDKLKRRFSTRKPASSPNPKSASPAPAKKPVAAAPAPIAESTTAPVTAHLTRAQIEAAIAKYGPTLCLHPDEQYFNTSIEWYLSHATLVDNKAVAPAGRIIHPTQDQLPTGAKDGTRYDLLLDDAAKVGDFTQAKAYINVFWKPGMSYTDIQFWFFSAFNGHSTGNFESLILNKTQHAGNVDLQPLGEHWADWEYSAIRIDNTSQELIGLMLSAHGKNHFHDATAIKTDFKYTNGTHPLIYSSLNGHANFPSVGPNFTDEHKVLGIPAGLEFNLVNTTADGGLQLDCSTRYQVVSAPFLTGTPDAYEIPSWINYPYRWGPEGTSITMDTKALGKILIAFLGPDANPLLKDPVVLLASWLLHVFVRQDINGAAAPSTQAPWIGKYA